MKDELEPMEPQLHALLNRGAAPIVPASEAQQRVLQKLATTLPVAGVATMAASTANAKLFWAKIMVLLASSFVLGAGAGGALVYSNYEPKVVYVERPVSTESVSPQPNPILNAPSPSVPTRPSEKTTPKTESVKAGKPPPSRPVTQTSRLKEESALIDAAKSEFVQGDIEGCFKTLEQHRNRFPDGILAEEREALAIQALVRLGRPTDAQSRAKDFLTNHASSLMAPVVENAIKDIPATE